MGSTQILIKEILLKGRTDKLILVHDDAELLNTELNLENQRYL